MFHLRKEIINWLKIRQENLHRNIQIKIHSAERYNLYVYVNY
jgi:hypothetical protein